MSKLILNAGQESSNVNNSNVNNRSQEQIISTLATLASSIGHELKGGFGTISIQVKLLERGFSTISKTAIAANQLLDNLQLQIKNTIANVPSKEGFKLCSIKYNIEEVLEQYCF